MSTTDYYLKVDPDAGYSEETAYAQFGHWLTVDASTMAAVVNTYALTAHDGSSRIRPLRLKPT